MARFNLRDKCTINTNRDADTFVGIQCENGNYSIHFPLGFHVSDSDKELRRDILLLLTSIKETTMKKESETYDQFKNYSQLEFPFQAFLAVIYDFYNRGYYKETEVVYNVAKRGKIDWNRTIKTQKTSMQDGQAFYLDFVTKRSSINENELITLIHEYCVFDSFEKIGWLFTDKLPAKSRLKFNYKLFKLVIREKLNHTFNDKNKKLFRNMLAIIEYEGEENDHREYRYGTNRFEYVWETMIDQVFGISEKERFFPKTVWRLDKNYSNACLEPDSIMLHNNQIYILDAKYYKYGQTKFPWDLPESTSINKQITYGEYVAENSKFDREFGKDRIVYNAFIMPFDATDPKWNTDTLISIGDAISDWKSGDKVYEHIQGILLDVKSLMRAGMHYSDDEVFRMAACIEKSVERMKQ